MKALFIGVMAAALMLSGMTAPASASGVTQFVPGAEHVAAKATVKTRTFVWKRKEIPACKPQRCYDGKYYYFALQARPQTGYLTSVKKLHLRVKRDNLIFVRKIRLFIGDGDLVYRAHVNKHATVLKAWVRASWRGRAPKQDVSLPDYGM